MASMADLSRFIVLLVLVQWTGAAPEGLSLRGLGHAALVDKNVTNLPVVLWHGMGDSCCDPRSIGGVMERLQDEFGLFVYSIATGKGESGDIWSSYFGNVNQQVKKVCDELKSVPQLQDGYNAVGFSQGGQFLRAVAERCQHLGPKMHVLVTMGGQHEGVNTIPGCLKETFWCQLMRSIMGRGSYSHWISQDIVQAQYFKDPFLFDEYLKYNPFLPDINNEYSVKNPQYAANLASLKKLVLFRFTNDTVVVPRDSAWFSYFDGKELVPVRQLSIYKYDWIGLKMLDERGDLLFGDCPGNHMNFTWDWFKDNIVSKYLVEKPPVLPFHKL